MNMGGDGCNPKLPIRVSEAEASDYIFRGGIMSEALTRHDENGGGGCTPNLPLRTTFSQEKSYDEKKKQTSNEPPRQVDFYAICHISPATIP